MRLGWPGIKALHEVIDHARARDLPVLLDAKRGDIGSTAENYAAAYLDDDSPIQADAITLSPYLGRDTLEPFTARARRGKGLLVLLKTSNAAPCGVSSQSHRQLREYSPASSSGSCSLSTMEKPWFTAVPPKPGIRAPYP